VRTGCKIFLIFSIATSSLLAAGEHPGATFLLIWPTARSTALGGAMTGLAEDADAAYWNPGGLGFQEKIGFDGTYGQWLPGLYPGMGYYYGSAGYGRSNFLNRKMILNVGLNYTYLNTGKAEIIDANGNYLGEITTYDEALGIQGGLRLSDKFGVGLGVKYIHIILPQRLDWTFPTGLGGEPGSSFAIDIGLLYKTLHSFSAGIAFANLGSKIPAPPQLSIPELEFYDPLPATFRIGLCYTPVDNEVLRLRILPELNKVLVGMFYDPLDTLNFGQELGYEWKEAWKSLGIEATIYNLFTWRFGYFEDITGARGGVRVIKDNYQEEYLSLLEYIFSRNRGHFDKIGITYGFGLNYKGYFSFDISDDHLIYDFNTSNVKFSLTSHDLVGLARKIVQFF
jgi:Type IX secretion system protein PorV